MKKKILSVAGLLAIAVTAFLSTDGNAPQAGETRLSDLFKINRASAECCVNVNPAMNTGRCSALTGYCYANPGGPGECDPFC